MFPIAVAPVTPTALEVPILAISIVPAPSALTVSALRAVDPPIAPVSYTHLRAHET